MRRAIVSLTIAIAALVPDRMRPSAQLSAVAVAARSPAAAVDTVLGAAVARGDVPGVAATAVTRNGIVYQNAFGVADAGTRRTLLPDAIFRIASMTKPITSV